MGLLADQRLALEGMRSEIARRARVSNADLERDRYHFVCRMMKVFMMWLKRVLIIWQ